MTPRPPAARASSTAISAVRLRSPVLMEANSPCLPFTNRPWMPSSRYQWRTFARHPASSSERLAANGVSVAAQIPFSSARARAFASEITGALY